MDHGIKAAELFLSGYNCAQAVAVAFCDVPVEEQEMQLAMLVLALDVVWVHVAVWAATEVLEARGVAKVVAKARVEDAVRERGKLVGRDKLVGKARLVDRGVQERHPDERMRWRMRLWKRKWLAL